ncbi:MAG: response regulator [Bacteroidales bacterium]|nr:response regulator [Bacteroidales bacterium]
MIITNGEVDNLLHDQEFANSYFTQYVNSCEIALNVIKSFRPDIIVCDYTQLKHNANDFLKHVRQQIPQVAVTILLDSNDKMRIVEAMKVGVNNIAFFQNNLDELKLYLKQYKYIIQTRKKATEPNPIISKNTFSTKTDNVFSNVPSIVDELLSRSNPIFSCWESEIRLGLEELIYNAIEHGNLNISFLEKTNALECGNFEELINERQKDVKYKDKKVFISFNQCPEYDELYIQDEGNGFDIGISIKEELHGRGIRLSRFFFDEIEYKENGNIVRVRRYVPKYES